jgi:excinuclease UvrABC nuclease subunit
MGLEYQTVKVGNNVAAWVKTLKNRSGVYIIRERGFLGEVVYVGESHTGRLDKTLMRHFQHWKGPTAGPTFAVSAVEVAIVRTPANKALDTQNAIIAEYSPRLNVIGKPKGFWESLLGV